MSTGKIMDLLKQCEHFDKDNRFMAAMDLCQEVQRLSEQQKIEEALEKRICAAFIKHLDDSSLDVQTNAIRSIQQVAGIIKEQHLVMIVETLADKVVGDGKKDVRDVYSLAIRSIIHQLHDMAAVNMIRAVYPKLMKGLKTGQEEIKEECLEILTEIFKNFTQLLIK
jgi:disulfide oxidoreductase YuzD